MSWFAALVVAVAGTSWLGPQLDRPAQRVVSLAPSTTELIFALGAGGRLVGVSRFDDFPEEVRNLPKVGGFVDLNIEAVLALSPDLVVSIETRGARRALETLARHGVAVLTVSSERLADLRPALTALGQALGRAEQAATVSRELSDALERTQAEYGAKPTPLRVLCIVGHSPLVAAGPASFVDELLGYAGAVNVLRSGTPYPELGLEAVAALGPELIVDLTPSSDDDVRSRLARLAKRGLLHHHDEALLRLGPRMPRGVAKLARALAATEPGAMK